MQAKPLALKARFIPRFPTSIRAPADSCYSEIVADQHNHVDKPEPRWQALLAFLAVGAIYLALPRNLIVGPIWLLPTIIVVLLVRTGISHRRARASLNRALGLFFIGLRPSALMASLGLLVRP